MSSVIVFGSFRQPAGVRHVDRAARKGTALEHSGRPMAAPAACLCEPCWSVSANPWVVDPGFARPVLPVWNEVGYDAGMKRVLIAGMIAILAGAAFAQENRVRAWQQRLQIDEPLPVPFLSVAPVNPFSVQLDVPPTLTSATVPQKLRVSGVARVAAYVDAHGLCHGAVPLELPFPSLTEAIGQGFRKARFHPALVGRTPRPAWVVLDVTLSGKIKDVILSGERLKLPLPGKPPAPAAFKQPYTPGRLRTSPAANPETLTTPPQPKKVRIRVGARQLETPLRALVHVTTTGRCDRFVPLDVPGGLVSWLRAYLATWRLAPAQRASQPVACWVVYETRAIMKFSRLSSTAVRPKPGVTFNPSGPAPAAATPGGA